MDYGWHSPAAVGLLFVHWGGCDIAKRLKSVYSSLWNTSQLHLSSDNYVMVLAFVMIY